MKKILTLTILILSLIIIVKPISTYSQTSSSQDYRLQQIEKLSATSGAKVATSSAKSKASTTFISGDITSVSGSAIFINTQSGTKLVFTSDSTKFYNFDSSGKKLIGLGDLKSGDSIDVIGLASETSSGSVKIVVREQTKVIKNFSLIGKVVEVNSTSLKISNLTRTDLPTISATLNNETTFTNNRSSTLKISEILVTDKITLAGYFDEKNNLITKQIFKISAASSKTATSSAN